MVRLGKEADTAAAAAAAAEEEATAAEDDVVPDADAVAAAVDAPVGLNAFCDADLLFHCSTLRTPSNQSVVPSILQIEGRGHRLMEISNESPGFSAARCLPSKLAQLAPRDSGLTLIWRVLVSGKRRGRKLRLWGHTGVKSIQFPITTGVDALVTSPLTRVARCITTKLSLCSTLTHQTGSPGAF